jgi:hypothetical protein
MVLSTAVLILSLLVVLGVGARFMSQSGYRVLANLRSGTEAFYVAEAGIAWSKDEVSRATSHPPAIASRTQNFASGAFSVAFTSPTAVTPLVAKVVVRSTGVVRTSSQVIQAQLTKQYDLADGALVARGNAVRVNFSAESFLISGMDHDPMSGAVISGAKPRPAISTSDEMLSGLIEQGLANNQQTGAIEGQGIAQSSYVPSSFISQFTDGLCNAAYALRMFVPSDGVLLLNAQSWGSQASPQLRCIDGLSAPGDIVNLGGSMTGAGILVVRNADLLVSGSFHWDGLIIVTGSSVGFKVTGTDAKEIYGSLIVNESGTPAPGSAILDIQGQVKALFSRPALSQLAALIPTSSLESKYISLPYTIKQDYWRSITP